MAVTTTIQDNPFENEVLSPGIGDSLIFVNSTNQNATLGFYLDISDIGEVTFYGSFDGNNYFEVLTTNKDTGAEATTATISGSYQVAIGGVCMFKIGVTTGGTIAGAISGVGVLQVQKPEASVILPTNTGTIGSVIIKGTQDDGTEVDIPVTAEGHLEVAIHSPRLPFGSIHTENLTPIFQADCVYGINPYESVSSTGRSISGANSGAVTGTSNLFKVATGATSYSFATLQSRKRLRYRAGQGVIGRFSALFSATAADSIVVAGVGTGESGFYFGYYNDVPYPKPTYGNTSSEFGILWSSGGVREILTLTVTVASASSGDITISLPAGDGVVVATVVTGITNAAGSQTLTAYQISKGTFPGWKAEQRGATVLFLADSVGDKTGTPLISQAGPGTATGTYAETLPGVLGTDNFIPQSQWNGDKLDGTGPSGVTLIPQNGNVYQINIQYLGYGSITFLVEAGLSPNNPNFVTAHTINIPNTQTGTSVSQPSFPFTMAAYSAGSTTDVSVSVGSYAGFLEGIKKLNGPRMSFIGAATSTTSSYTPLFTIRNSYAHSHSITARANQSVVNLLSVSGAAKGNTNAITTFYVLRNAELTVGTPNFTRYSALSCIYSDTGATTCTIATNDQIVWSGTVTQDGNFIFDFSDEISLQPGETLTLAVKSNAATATTVGQLNIREDQ